MTTYLHRFNEYGPGMGLPSMTVNFQREPYAGQKEIVNYLKKGKKTYAAAGRARDFFTGETIMGEYCGMTDGTFTWSSTLAHYVEKYNLKLPKEFEDRVLKTAKNG